MRPHGGTAPRLSLNAQGQGRQVWLEHTELEDSIAASTRGLYERDMSTLVPPAFAHHTLRELSVSKIDRFLKAQIKTCYGGGRTHARWR